jgi:hypothetical protein
MKKYLIAAFFIVCTTFLLKSQGVFFAKASGGVSYVEKDSNTIAQNGSYEVAGSLTTTRYVASKFLTTSAYNLNKVDVYLAKVGSPTNDIICEIWTVDGSNLPGALVGSSSAAVNAATFAASEGVVSFFPTATLANATEYFIVLRSATNSATDYTLWYRNTDGTVERIANTDNPGTGWVGVATTRQCKFKTYGDS